MPAARLDGGVEPTADLGDENPGRLGSNGGSFSQRRAGDGDPCSTPGIHHDAMDSGGSRRNNHPPPYT